MQCNVYSNDCKLLENVYSTCGLCGNTQLNASENSILLTRAQRKGVTYLLCICEDEKCPDQLCANREIVHAVLQLHIPC